jgi:hypothetical protein
LRSHYRFAEHFCGVNRPNEKGVVEATVKFARLKFLVPVPQVRDLEALNAQLVAQCRRDLSRTLRGQKASKALLLAEDQAAFLPLPEVPFDACRKTWARACSLSVVRFDTNDYSVPGARSPLRAHSLRPPQPAGEGLRGPGGSVLCRSGGGAA